MPANRSMLVGMGCAIAQEAKTAQPAPEIALVSSVRAVKAVFVPPVQTAATERVKLQKAKIARPVLRIALVLQGSAVKAASVSIQTAKEAPSLQTMEQPQNPMPTAETPNLRAMEAPPNLPQTASRPKIPPRPQQRTAPPKRPLKPTLTIQTMPTKARWVTAIQQEKRTLLAVDATANKIPLPPFRCFSCSCSFSSFDAALNAPHAPAEGFDYLPRLRASRSR